MAFHATFEGLRALYQISPVYVFIPHNSQVRGLQRCLPINIRVGKKCSILCARLWQSTSRYRHILEYSAHYPSCIRVQVSVYGTYRRFRDPGAGCHREEQKLLAYQASRWGPETRGNAQPRGHKDSRVHEHRATPPKKQRTPRFRKLAPMYYISRTVETMAAPVYSLIRVTP